MPRKILNFIIFGLLIGALLAAGGYPTASLRAAETKAEDQTKEASENKKDGQEKEEKKEPDPTEFVQLASFPIRTFKLNGARAPQAVITIFLQVADESRAIYVCRVEPRIRHAVLGELSRGPVYRTPDGLVPVDGLRDRLFPAINAAIGDPLVLNIVIRDDLRLMTEGAQITIPKSTEKCRRLPKPEPEDDTKSGEGENEGH